MRRIQQVTMIVMLPCLVRHSGVFCQVVQLHVCEELLNNYLGTEMKATWLSHSQTTVQDDTKSFGCAFASAYVVDSWFVDAENLPAGGTTASVAASSDAAAPQGRVKVHVELLKMYERASQCKLAS